jgi:drug/metabolite transporter (DMT)-like permease
MPSSQRGVWAALGTVYLVWGSTYLAIRWSLETMPPFLSAAARFLVAGAILACWVRVRSGPASLRMQPRQLRNAVVCGVLLLTGGNGMVVVAEKHIPSGLAALLVAAVPLWLVVLRRLTGERVRAVTLLGVVVGLVGVAVLLLPGGSGGPVSFGYSALVVAAALSWALGSMVAIKADVPANPAMMSAVEMIAGGAVLAVIGTGRGEFGGLDLSAISTKSWLSLGYLIVFGSIVAFSCYVWVLGNAPTSLVATYAYVNPAVAVLLGVWLAGEHLRAAEVVGGLIILASVVVVVRAESARRRVRRPARTRPWRGRSTRPASLSDRPEATPSSPRPTRPAGTPH